MIRPHLFFRYLLFLNKWGRTLIYSLAQDDIRGYCFALALQHRRPVPGARYVDFPS